VKLFQWPLRGRVRVVTYTFRLAVVEGEATTPLDSRTYPFTIVLGREMDAERVRQAVTLEASAIAAKVTESVVTELLNAIEAARTE
jgi:hypothetical protein